MKRKKTLETLMSMPWTRVGPTEVRTPEGTHFEIRIEELPDFFVADRTAKGAEDELQDALRAFLSSYVERDALPPLPQPKWQIAVVSWQVPGGRSYQHYESTPQSNPQETKTINPAKLVPAAT